MESRPRKSAQVCRVCWATSPQNCSRTSAVKCCHCSVHGASVAMGVSLLQWRMGLPSTATQLTPVLYSHREDYITHQSLTVADIDQRVFEALRRARSPWDAIGLHFHQSSLFVNVPGVEDQLGLCRMAVDTIMR